MADLAPRSVPTAGHLLTSMEVSAMVTQASRNRIPSGAMVRYPWEAVPIGWARCNGGPVHAAHHPQLAKVVGSMLPNDPDWIIKL